MLFEASSSMKAKSERWPLRKNNLKISAHSSRYTEEGLWKVKNDAWVNIKSNFIPDIQNSFCQTKMKTDDHFCKQTKNLSRNKRKIWILTTGRQKQKPIWANRGWNVGRRKRSWSTKTWSTPRPLRRLLWPSRSWSAQPWPSSFGPRRESTGWSDPGTGPRWRTWSRDPGFPSLVKEISDW